MNNIVKILKSTGFIGALAFVSALNSQAGTITLTDSWGGGNGLGGGEFTANGDAQLTNIANLYYNAKAKVGSGFETFCLEESQGIQLGVSYNYAISQTTKNVIDPLSVGSAYLYAAFSNGNLAGYNYTNLAQRSLDADTLQIAFWWLEDEVGFSYDATNKFELAVVTQFGSIAKAKADNNGLYSVAVLNITDANGRDRQDQIVRVPEGGVTVALLGFAVLGLAVIRRKMTA